MILNKKLLFNKNDLKLNQNSKKSKHEIELF